MNATVGRLALLAFLLTPIVAVAYQAETKPTTATLEISIAIPEYGGHRYIEFGLRDSHFSVVVCNVSNAPVTLWTSKYSWGWDNLSFEIRDAAGLVRTVKKTPREWDKNFPDVCTLLPNDTMVLAADFKSAEWTDPPKPAAPDADGKPTVISMRAVYFIAPDEESKQLGVWTGRAESPWRDYTLLP